MPLDHYVSQVHLKNFYSPLLGERMFAIRKSDMKYFTPKSKNVCGIHDGSTNAHLREDREIEEFLKTIEPNYNSAVENLRAGDIDNNSIYTIAGFIAHVITNTYEERHANCSNINSSLIHALYYGTIY